MTHQQVDDIADDPNAVRRRVHARQSHAARKARLALQESEWNAACKDEEVPDVKN